MPQSKFWLFGCPAAVGMQLALFLALLYVMPEPLHFRYEIPAGLEFWQTTNIKCCRDPPAMKQNSGRQPRRAIRCGSVDAEVLHCSNLNGTLLQQC